MRVLPSEPFSRVVLPVVASINAHRTVFGGGRRTDHDPPAAPVADDRHREPTITVSLGSVGTAEGAPRGRPAASATPGGKARAARAPHLIRRFAPRRRATPPRTAAAPPAPGW